MAAREVSAGWRSGAVGDSGYVDDTIAEEAQR
jgi:hypothetical protein